MISGFVQFSVNLVDAIFLILCWNQALPRPSPGSLYRTAPLYVSLRTARVFWGLLLVSFFGQNVSSVSVWFIQKSEFFKPSYLPGAGFFGQQFIVECLFGKICHLPVKLAAQSVWVRKAV